MITDLKGKGPPRSDPYLERDEPTDSSNLVETKIAVKDKVGTSVPACDPEGGRRPGDAGTDKPALHGIKNERDKETRIVQPWLFEAKVPAGLVGNKAEYRNWRNKEDTKHLLYSASVGGHATNARVSKDNPVQMICGLIADYDQHATPELIKTRLANWNGAYLPNWLHRTFSGGVRLLWLFEKFVPLDDKEFQQKFLQIARQKLSADSHFAGLDESAWNNLTKYFDVGADWQEVSESPIESSHVEAWMTEANAKMRWKSEDTLIPLGDVAAEIERQYPGQMQLDRRGFEQGARCNAFWEGRQNPTAAVIHERGVIAFSSHKLFHTWRAILGDKFVDLYTSDKIGRAAEGKYFDGQRYWVKTADGWAHRYKEDLVMRLRKHRLDASKKSDNTSEVENVLLYIQERHSVTGAAPFLFNEKDVVRLNGEKILNTSTAKVVSPAETPQKWGENFPWLAEFIDTCWDDSPVACVEEGEAQPAKDVFLAWLHRFYTTSLQGALDKGQALFLAGKTGVGKTLLSTHVIAPSVGGGADATRYLMGDTQFTKNLFKVACWEVHDAKAKEDPRAFAEMVKKTVANPGHVYEAKFHDAVPILWDGRVVVSLNADDDSLAMVPDTSSGLADKLILLKFSDSPRNFPPKWKLEPMIASELPYFLRFLVDWSVPEAIKGSNRYGIKAYVHEQTQNAAALAGGVEELLEAFTIFGRRRFEDHDTLTAGEWLSKLTSEDGIGRLVSKLTTKSLAKKLVKASKLHSGKAVDVEVVRSETQHKGDLTKYKVTFRDHWVKSAEDKLQEIKAKERKLKAEIRNARVLLGSPTRREGVNVALN